MTQHHFQPSRVGVLIANSELQLLHCNAEAASILAYPKKPPHTLTQNAALPATLLQSNLSQAGPSSGVEFISGRRRYLCRSFRLDLKSAGNNTSLPLIVAMLDRVQAEPLDITRWGERFQLTGREREAVTHLLRGLTSKEIAQAMHISPNTVKSFLKMVRVKVGASSRAGIVAKIIDRLGPMWVCFVLDLLDILDGLGSTLQV